MDRKRDEYRDGYERGRTSDSFDRFSRDLVNGAGESKSHTQGYEDGVADQRKEKYG